MSRVTVPLVIRKCLVHDSWQAVPTPMSFKPFTEEIVKSFFTITKGILKQLDACSRTSSVLSISFQNLRF